MTGGEEKDMKRIFMIIIGGIITFFVPFVQAYLTNGLLTKNGKVNWLNLVKSPLFWIFLIIWLVSCLLTSGTSEDKKDKKNTIRGNINGNVQQDVTNNYYISDPATSIRKASNDNQIRDVLEGMAESVASKHPLAPYYTLAVKLENNKVTLYSKEAIPEASKKYPINYKGKFTISTEGKSFDEIIRRSKVSQKPIEIKCVDIVKMLGDTIDPYPDEILRHKEDCRFYLVPEELPPAEEYLLMIKGGEVIYDNVMLRIQPVNPDDKIFVFSNIDDKKSIGITLTYYIEEKKSTFSYSFIADTWYQVRKNIKFLMEARKGAVLQLKKKSTGESLMEYPLSKSLETESLDRLKTDLEFVEKIIKIQDRFSVTIDSQAEISKSDERCIEYLDAGIDNRTLNKRWSQMCFVSIIQPELFESEDESETVFVYEEEIDFIIGNLEFRKIKIKNRLLGKIENRNELKDIYNNINLQDTPHKIVIIPSEKDNEMQIEVDLSELQIYKVDVKRGA